MYGENPARKYNYSADACVLYNKYKLHIIFYGGNARRRSLKRPHPLKRVRNCIEEHNTKIKTTKISVDSTLLS